MRRSSHSSMSRSVSLGPEEHGVNREERATTVGTEPQIKEEEEEEEGDGVSVADGASVVEGEEEEDSDAEGTVIQTNDATKIEPQDDDSLVSELLDDDGDTVMGG